MLPLLFTYPISNIILSGSFHPSYSISKISINVSTAELQLPYSFSHVVLENFDSDLPVGLGQD